MSCLFCKIVEGSIPSTPVYQDELCYAFADINPQAPVHVLVVPKGDFVSLADFCAGAPDALITGYFRAIGRVAAQLGLVEHGFRGLFNVGTDGGQEVPHLHIHLFGGKRLGPMLVRG